MSSRYSDGFQLRDHSAQSIGNQYFRLPVQYCSFSFLCKQAWMNGKSESHSDDGPHIKLLSVLLNYVN